MKILTADQQYIVEKYGGYEKFIVRLVAERWNEPVDWTEPKGDVKAEVMHSNWIAQCPFCNGANIIEPGKLFYCPDCMMQDNGFKAMKVIWPRKRKQIEAVLLKRGDTARRNWLKHETIDDLIRENLEHGIK